jgi:flagellar biosynthetic protein FliQ
LTDTTVMELATRTIMLTARLTAPILIVSLVVGLGVSLLQSVTQVQEVTLTFVPKLVGIAVVLMVGGHWMLGELVGFTHSLFDMVPQLISTT